MTILDSAEWLLQADNYSGSGDWLDEANNHDGQFGSTSGADMNDPLFKDFADFDRQSYMNCPGITGNYAHIPTATYLDPGTSDVAIWWDGAIADYSPATDLRVVSRYVAVGDHRLYNMFFRDVGGNQRPGLTIGSSTGTFRATVLGDALSGISDGERIQMKIEIDADNDAGGTDVTMFVRSGANLKRDLTDDTDWTDLGTDTISGVQTWDAVTAELAVMAESGGALQSAGDMRRLIVYHSLDQTNLVVDIDFRDVATPFASFIESSTNAATVTISRGGSAGQTVIVERNKMLLTTDDFFEIADDAQLDFAAADSGTWIVAFYTNTVASGSDVLLAKKDDLTTALGYALVRNAATGQGIIADGTLDDDDTVATVAVNTLHTLAMVRNTTDDDIEVFLDGVGSGSATPDSTTTPLANALPLRLGATSGAAANFGEFQLIAAAGWPPGTALTDTEVLEAHNLLTRGPLLPKPARLIQRDYPVEQRQHQVFA